jgi:hypothetical protein
VRLSWPKVKVNSRVQSRPRSSLGKQIKGKEKTRHGKILFPLPPSSQTQADKTNTRAYNLANQTRGEDERKRKGKIRPGKIRCLSLKQAVEISGSPFHLRVRLFLDGCCMDLDESRAQFLGNKSSDRTVILLSISGGFNNTWARRPRTTSCFRRHTKIL